MTETTNHHQMEVAKSVFKPDTFGEWEEYGNGYRCSTLKEPVIITPMGWEGNNIFPISRPTLKDRVTSVVPPFLESVINKSLDNALVAKVLAKEKPELISALDFVGELQQEVWGLQPKDIVPANVSTILEKTGSKLLVAYKEEKGFTPEGWVGFVIAFGANSDTLVSHMVGVEENLRSHGYGMALKMFQAHYALEAGFTKVAWSVDPMRGINAALNYKKLGGVCNDLVIDMYGELDTELYGLVPTDRTIITWDLLSQAVHDKVQSHLPPHKSQDQAFPFHQVVESSTHVTAENIQQVLLSNPKHLVLEIPRDIDQLMIDPNNSEALRQAEIARHNMRVVLSSTLNTSRVSNISKETTFDPSQLEVVKTSGDYFIQHFGSYEPRPKSISQEAVSMPDSGVPVKNLYILTRKND